MNISAKSFGETIRGMREAQKLGLRHTAERLGISPAYLSRIERGKERPPSPDVVKRIAQLLGGDPDVLFRLADSTDPDLAEYMHHVPKIPEFLRTAKELGLESADFDELIAEIQRRHSTTSRGSNSVTRKTTPDNSTQPKKSKNNADGKSLHFG